MLKSFEKKKQIKYILFTIKQIWFDEAVYVIIQQKDKFADYNETNGPTDLPKLYRNKVNQTYIIAS